MKALREKASLVRLFALVAVLALVAVACDDGGDATDDTDGGTETTVPDDTSDTTAPDDTSDTTAPDDTSDTTAPAEGGELDTYTMGIFADVTTDNYWNTIDSSGSTVWNSYLWDPTHDALYDLAYPGIEFVPSLAASELPEPTQEGDVWVAEVPLKEGATWSDGEPITAEDVAFSWNVAREFELGGNWTDYVDAEVVTAVEAVDDTTLRVEFNEQPGLAVWGPGNGVPFIPAMPEHFWAPIVEEARGSDDPRAALLAASGAEEPASGPTVFEDREEGSFAASTANENYHNAGEEITSGDVTYTDGPHANNFQFTFYGGQDAAVLALANGETDFLLNPLGMQRGLQQQVEGNEDLTAIVNPTNGFRYMAFNLTKAPMNDLAFRRALSVLIDKEFVTESVLQGVAYPVYAMVPEGNTAWYNEEVANQIAEQQMAGAETQARQEEAIRILEEAGYTWETAPGYDEEGTFTAGSGLIDPDGNPIEQLELITPTASYDPLRAAFGNYISGAALELGIPIVAIPTEFNTIIQQVYVPNEQGELTYDMFILGWSLGNPALPTFHESFFGGNNLTVVNDGNNNTGYDNQEFNNLVQQFNQTQSTEEAYEVLWQMEQNLAENLPYITLFDTGILEFYNNRVTYPFTETLSGLQFLSGEQNYVTSS